MVSYLKLEVYGATLRDIVEAATEQWRRFIGDDAAALPHDAEVHITEHSEREYVATVTIRTRVSQ